MEVKIIKGTKEEVQEILRGMDKTEYAVIPNRQEKPPTLYVETKVGVKSPRGRYKLHGKGKWATWEDLNVINALFDPSGTTEAHKNNMLLARKLGKEFSAVKRLYDLTQVHGVDKYAAKISRAKGKLSKTACKVQPWTQIKSRKGGRVYHGTQVKAIN